MKFSQKILRIGDFEKLSFFCFIPMKISHKLCVRMDGTQFLWLWWLIAKNGPHQALILAVYIHNIYKENRLYISFSWVMSIYSSVLFNNIDLIYYSCLFRPMKWPIWSFAFNTTTKQLNFLNTLFKNRSLFQFYCPVGKRF